MSWKQNTKVARTEEAYLCEEVCFKLFLNDAVHGLALTSPGKAFHKA